MYPLDNITQTNALAILTAVFYYKSLTPPNAPIPNVEVMNKSWFERSIWFRTTSSKGVVCAMSFLDVATALRLSTDPGSCAASLGLSTTPPAIAIIGAATTIVAGLLRAWCFAELGTLFDFAFNIKADHRLVTTGPYAYVRHPSYTGCFAAYIGATIFMYAPGQWLRECGSGSVVGVAVSCVWFWNLVVCFHGLGRRMGAEDEGLRRWFGKEWDEFAQRVPCRLIPGLPSAPHRRHEILKEFTSTTTALESRTSHLATATQPCEFKKSGPSNDNGTSNRYVQGTLSEHLPRPLVFPQSYSTSSPFPYPWSKLSMQDIPTCGWHPMTGNLDGS